MKTERSRELKISATSSPAIESEQKLMKPKLEGRQLGEHRVQTNADAFDGRASRAARELSMQPAHMAPAIASKAFNADGFDGPARRGARDLSIQPALAAPAVAMPAAAQAAAPAMANEQSITHFHTVQPGDTLGAIAKSFGTTADAIASENGISNPDFIFPGRELSITTSGSAASNLPRFHTVKPGDMLGKIAQKFGSTVQAIAAANGISNPNLISPGQVLRIPAGTATPITVTPPDTSGPKNVPTTPSAPTVPSAPISTEPTVSKNVRTAMDYAQGLVGAPYAWWTNASGPLGEGAPAWVGDGPPPSRSQVFQNGVFCAGIANLMLRSVGKGDEIPQNYPFDGGTRAYYNKYREVSERFNPNKDYPEGTLFIRNFRNEVDQGHVAIMQADGTVLQSYPGAGGVNGVSDSVSLANSNFMNDGSNYYELAVLPENWLGGRAE